MLMPFLFYLFFLIMCADFTKESNVESGIKGSEVNRVGGIRFFFGGATSPRCFRRQCWKYCKVTNLAEVPHPRAKGRREDLLCSHPIQRPKQWYLDPIETRERFFICPFVRFTFKSSISCVNMSRCSFLGLDSHATDRIFPEKGIRVKIATVGHGLWSDLSSRPINEEQGVIIRAREFR